MIGAKQNVTKLRRGGLAIYYYGLYTMHRNLDPGGETVSHAVLHFEVNLDVSNA